MALLIEFVVGVIKTLIKAVRILFRTVTSSMAFAINATQVIVSVAILVCFLRIVICRSEFRSEGTTEDGSENANAHFEFVN